MQNKKILVIFSGGEFSEATVNFATRFATSSNSFISGIFLHDLSYYYVNTGFSLDPVPYEIPVDMIQDIDAEVQDRIDENIRRFKDICNAAGVKYIVHLDRGLATQEIVEESRYADMILLSYTDITAAARHPQTSNIMESILRQSCCPLFVTPYIMPEVKELVYMHTEQAESAQAIKLFTYLMQEHFAALPVHITSIQTTSADAQTENRMLEYIKVHYADASLTPYQGTFESYVSELRLRKDILLITAVPHRSFFARILHLSAAPEWLQHIAFPVFLYS